MTADDFEDLFKPDTLEKLFPKSRSDEFFEALYGDSSEGAYDIYLRFKGHNQRELEFEFELKQRPEKCLGCSLTFGLPQIFPKHPIINLKGLVQEIGELLDGRSRLVDWKVGFTQIVSPDLHVIPIIIFLEDI